VTVDTGHRKDTEILKHNCVRDSCQLVIDYWYTPPSPPCNIFVHPTLTIQPQKN